MVTLHEELSAEGFPFDVYVVNIAGAESTSANLVNACEFPILQDVSAVNAWGLHGGGKDDVYIYDSNGLLSAYLEYGGSVSTALSTPEGYANVKNAIQAAFGP